MRRTLLLIFLLLAPPMTAVVVSAVRERNRLPRRFAEVVPERVFRGGYPSADSIRHLVQTRSIQTVLSLTGPTDKSEEAEMLRSARDLRLECLRIPMPGDGVASFEDLDRAADLIADQTKWPIFFHCAAGKQRSNASQAAFRMKHAGWTVDQALLELEQKHGLDRENEAALCDNLRAYSKHLKDSNNAKNDIESGFLEEEEP